MTQPSLTTELAGLSLRSPVMTASGCFGWGREYSRCFSLAKLGAVVSKAVTLEAREGNPVPRVTETAAGMLNSIGLANPGLQAVLADELPWLTAQDVPVFVNVAGSSGDDYCCTAAAISSSGLAAAVELNVSCPNVAQGGLAFGTDPGVLRSLVASVRQVIEIPLFVKLSPNVTDIVPLAAAAVEAGADGLTLVNTLRGMAVDTRTRRPVLGTGCGGLSGPAIKPVALAMVYQVAKHMEVPIIGCGGIASAQDVVEFLLVGASAVQVGTANFTSPSSGPDITGALLQWMEKEGITTLEEIKGAAL